MAARPRTLPAAIAPVLVGSAAAFDVIDPGSVKPLLAGTELDSAGAPSPPPSPARS